jgi:hypothetical protein
MGIDRGQGNMERLGHFLGRFATGEFTQDILLT